MCVGRARGSFADLSSLFEKRIRRYCRLEIIEVPEVRYKGVPTLGEIARITSQEAEHALKAVGARDSLIVLDAAGRQWSSPAFSQTLSDMAVQGMGDAAFVIGGSLGLASSLRSRALHLLSLSSMTLPHQLARVVLLEQIYRAFTIQRNEPYHK